MVMTVIGSHRIVVASIKDFAGVLLVLSYTMVSVRAKVNNPWDPIPSS